MINLSVRIIVFVRSCSRTSKLGVVSRNSAIAIEDKTCDNAYLKPHPVPPRTIAATRMAPAMDPIIRLVALGPVTKDHGKK